MSKINPSINIKFSRVGKVITVIIILLVMLFTALYYINSGSYEYAATDKALDKQEKLANQQQAVQQQRTTPAQKQQNYSNAFKLAAMEVGHQAPSQSLIDDFDNLLNQLSKKCPNESEDKIANYLFVGREAIKKNFKEITLLDYGIQIYKSIPDEAVGMIKCDETAALVAALIINSSN